MNIFGGGYKYRCSGEIWKGFMGDCFMGNIFFIK